MKKLFLLTSFILYFCLSWPVYANNYDDKILSLFKTVYYSGDPNIKILDFKYKKISKNEYESQWESYIKIKSCYKKSVYCQTSIVVTDKEGYPISQGRKGNNNIATLFNKDINKNSISEQIKEISFNKKNVDIYLKNNYEFSIHTSCGINYDRNLIEKYPPDHKYWQQFAPGQCE